MRFLLVGKVSPAVAEAVTRHGHTALGPDAIGLAEDAPREQLIREADKAQLDILTADADIADAPYAHDIWFKRTIVYLQVAGGDVEQDDAIDRLFERYKRLAARRLYTVTGNRVKIRQLPGGA